MHHDAQRREGLDRCHGDVVDGVVEGGLLGEPRYVDLHEAHWPAADPHHTVVELAPHDDHAVRVAIVEVGGSADVNLRVEAGTLKLRCAQTTHVPGRAHSKQVRRRQRISRTVQEVLLIERRILVNPTTQLGNEYRTGIVANSGDQHAL